MGTARSKRIVGDQATSFEVSIIEQLVGHMVADVERELIVTTLNHFEATEPARRSRSAFQCDACATRYTNSGPRASIFLERVRDHFMIRETEFLGQISAGLFTRGG